MFEANKRGWSVTIRQILVNCRTYVTLLASLCLNQIGLLSLVSPSGRWYRLPYWRQLNVSLRQLSLTLPLLFEKACHEQDPNPCFSHVGDL